jgi:hypothetical protein
MGNNSRKFNESARTLDDPKARFAYELLLGICGLAPIANYYLTQPSELRFIKP